MSDQRFSVDLQSAVPIDDILSLSTSPFWPPSQQKITTGAVDRVNQLALTFKEEKVPLDVSISAGRCINLNSVDLERLIPHVDSVDWPWVSSIRDDIAVLLENLAIRYAGGTLNLASILKLSQASYGTYLLHLPADEREAKVSELVRMVSQKELSHEGAPENSSRQKMVLRFDYKLITSGDTLRELRNLINSFPQIDFEIQIEPSYGFEDITDWESSMRAITELVQNSHLVGLDNLIGSKVSFDLKNCLLFGVNGNVLELLNRTCETAPEKLARIELSGFKLDKNGKAIDTHGLPWVLPEGQGIVELEVILAKLYKVKGQRLPITIETNPLLFEGLNTGVAQNMLKYFR